MRTILIVKVDDHCAFLDQRISCLVVCQRRIHFSRYFTSTNVIIKLSNRCFANQQEVRAKHWRRLRTLVIHFEYGLARLDVQRLLFLN